MYNYQNFTRNKINNCMEIKKVNNCLPESKDSYDKIEKIRGKQLDANLNKVAKGMGILFFGQIIGAILGLIGSILIARTYSVGEYGVFGLGINIVSIFLTISTLGILDGSNRFISYYIGKKDNIEVKGIIRSSLLIVSLSSIICAILLFFLSDFIANQFFGIDRLATVIKIFVIGLPFLAIINLIINIFRGFESVKENFYFSSFLLPFVKIPLYAIVVFLSLSFYYIAIAYTLSIIITFFIILFYFIKRLPESIKKIQNDSMHSITLLYFSLPLLISGLGMFLISGVDKLILGSLAKEVEVGLYTTAVSLAQYLLLFYSVSIFIYQPIVSRLVAENNIVNIKEIYQILTKWITILSLPFIILLLLFPETIISIIYGEKYIQAAIALQILTIAYFVHILSGPNGATLISFGKTKIIMYFTLIAGIITILSNYLLIPIFGIEGAALSTVIAYIMMNILNGIYLFKISKIHPFRKKFIFPIIIFLVFLSIFYFFVAKDLSGILRILSYIVLILSYFIIIILSRSIDEEDLQVLLYIEKKVGIKFNLLRKIINRFL